MISKQVGFSDQRSFRIYTNENDNISGSDCYTLENYSVEFFDYVNAFTTVIDQFSEKESIDAIN